MNYADLINTITTRIATNGQQAITAQVLQDVLVDMVQEMGQSGALVGGVVDTSYVPDPSNDAQLIYIAQGIGTYPNFGGLTVVDGEVAFFYYDGNAWQKSSVSVNVAVEVIDNLTSTATDKALSANQGRELDEKKADKVSGATAGNMAGLDADGNLVDSGVPASAVGDVSDKIDKVHDAEVGNVPMFKADGGIEDGGVAADNIAEQDGYYETMVVGGAENLIGNDIVSSQFTRRKTGGSTDVGTGVAILKTIKGNTLVFNQMVSNGDFSNGSTGWTTGGTVTVADNKATVTYTTTSVRFVHPSMGLTVGHKYYLSAFITPDMACTLNIELSFGWVTVSKVANANERTFVSGIVTTTASGSDNLQIFGNFGVTPGYTLIVERVNCIDLTRMFGAGNEPSTVAEFEALFPLNYYAYNAGTLLNLTATGLQTNGFNQWNEEWGNYYWDISDGTRKNSGSSFGCSNHIPVLPSTTYYMQRPYGSFYVLQYDAEKNLLSYAQYFNAGTFTTAANCRYITFYSFGAYGTTYNHDICINKSDTDKNGTYEPYWSETLQTPITTATSGGVAIFPDGEKSAGGKADRYYKSAGSEHFDKAEKWIASRAYQAGDESDSTVKTDGTTTYYALSTPTDYTLDTPFSAQYRVDGMGTETLLPQNTATPTTSPINAEVKYPMNAVDTLRNLPQNYISKASMDAILTAFKTAGVITNYTLTWDATNQKYNCSITV